MRLSFWLRFFLTRICALGIVLGPALTVVRAQAQAGTSLTQTVGGLGQTVMQGIAATPSFGEVLANATQLAKSGNATAVETLLVAQNKSTPNTANWHFETTRNLIQVANTVARQGQISAVPALAASALQHLNQAATLAKNNVVRAQAKASAGYIQEHFVGDVPSAIASYQEAVQLNPKDKGSQQTLVRLQQADAILRARIHPATKP